MPPIQDDNTVTIKELSYDFGDLTDAYKELNDAKSLEKSKKEALDSASKRVADAEAKVEAIEAKIRHRIKNVK